MNNKFSENLKKIRKENNLSQEQLADELGVSRQAISKWESAVAYPEMDKIIALCDKFNMNIDDLLHKDIKEIKSEEDSKKRINTYIDDFLKFITNTINMFSSMSFKSKIKCLFEQFLIAAVLFVLSLIIYSAMDYISYNIISFLPGKVYSFVSNLLDSLFIIILLIISIIIIIHIFKTRYLDYYDEYNKNIKNDKEEKSDNDSSGNKEKIEFKKDQDKIIIRDPKHSEYRFIKGLLKTTVFIIKLFSLLLALFLIAVLVFLVISLVVSFLISETELFFVGALLSILSSIVISVIFLLIIINFVFNRVSDKKKMIYSFILSIIIFGIGVGLAFIGSLDFTILENDDSLATTKVSSYQMSNNFMIEGFNNINYIESDNDDIKVEYKYTKCCDLIEEVNSDNRVNLYFNCDNVLVFIKEIIKNINDKKIIPIDNRIYEINIYSNKRNIDIIKNNVNKELERIKQEENDIRTMEETISRLESENNRLQIENSELKEQLNLE